MKNISRIFSAVICSVSLFAVDAVAAVATTAGSDLTGYNPSNAYNNQWSSMTNVRYDNAPSNNGSAKADFGNCNAIVLRCAQPKCANGGCADMNIAATIVSGCVKSNTKCKQYGDDLIQFMSAQLVASSNAKANAVNAEQVAAAQAASQQAQMAAQQAVAAQQQQMAEMQSQMQQQMMQMQQQMAEQNAQSAQQIADALAQSQQQQAAALAQSQQQQAAALSEMQSAAQQNYAMQQQSYAANAPVQVTTQEQDAISRGVDSEVLVRSTITGQILSDIEGAENQLKEVKAAMGSAFTYADCDDRGDGCKAPKRIKKWRELASEFITPYDAVVDKIYDALITAQSVGVEMSEIYMMLNNSCNSWGEYLCPPGDVTYDSGDEKGQRGAPSVCERDCSAAQDACFPELQKDEDKTVVQAAYNACLNKYGCGKNNCRPCTLLKILNDKDEVYQGWIDAEASTKSNQKVIACASQALSGNSLFARKMKAKNGVGLIDIDKLDRWINQKEPGSVKADVGAKYCGTTGEQTVNNTAYTNLHSDNTLAKLQAVMVSRSFNKNAKTLCVTELGGDSDDKSDDCAYIRPMYGICDTHAYNLNMKENTDDSTIRDDMDNVIATKVTVLSQQMYKQYEYLSATLRRLKTQLRKSVLTAQLEVAGASSDSSSGSGKSSSSSSRYENCAGKDENGMLYCLRQNYSALYDRINNKQCNKEEKKQLAKDISMIANVVNAGDNKFTPKEDCKAEAQIKGKTECSDCLDLYNIGIMKFQNYLNDQVARRNGGYRWGN